MNLLFFQVRLFTVRVRLKLRASVALSPVFSLYAEKMIGVDDWCHREFGGKSDRSGKQAKNQYLYRP